MKRLHIWDLDGTLADSSHRYRTAECGTRIDLEFWRANEWRALEDSPTALVADYNAAAAIGDYNVIATARIGCKRTAQWIAQYLAPPVSVIARRGPDDTRGGAELKLVGIRRLLNLKQFQQFQEFPERVTVYEDNADYLAKLCRTLGCFGVFVPSKQGH